MESAADTTNGANIVQSLAKRSQQSTTNGSMSDEKRGGGGRSSSRSSSGSARGRSRSPLSDRSYSSPDSRRRRRRRSRSSSSDRSTDVAAPVQNVDWGDVAVNVAFAEKVFDASDVFICDSCRLPVITFGRLLPCKHTFCIDCAKHKMKNGSDGSRNCCTKCRNVFTDIETYPLASLYICTEGGSNAAGGCRRSYKSVADLKIHKEQRHPVEGGDADHSEDNDIKVAAGSSIVSSSATLSAAVQYANAAAAKNSAHLMPQMPVFQMPPGLPSPFMQSFQSVPGLPNAASSLRLLGSAAGAVPSQQQSLFNRPPGAPTLLDQQQAFYFAAAAQIFQQQQQQQQQAADLFMSGQQKRMDR